MADFLGVACRPCKELACGKLPGCSCRPCKESACGKLPGCRCRWCRPLCGRSSREPRGRPCRAPGSASLRLSYRVQQTSCWTVFSTQTRRQQVVGGHWTFTEAAATGVIHAAARAGILFPVAGIALALFHLRPGTVSVTVCHSPQQTGTIFFSTIGLQHGVALRPGAFSFGLVGRAVRRRGSRSGSIGLQTV